MNALTTGWKTAVGLFLIALSGGVYGAANAVDWTVPANLEMVLDLVKQAGDVLIKIGIAHKLVKARNGA